MCRPLRGSSFLPATHPFRGGLGCFAPSALEAEIEDEDEFEDEVDFGWDGGYVDERPPFWLSTRPESLNDGRRERAVRIRGKALG